MANLNETCDVLIAHAPSDGERAQSVASSCRAHGLAAFTDAELQSSANVSDSLWEALAESRALVLLLPPSGLTPAMALEVGAARAWEKPILAILTDPSRTQLPPELSQVPLYTLGRIEDVIHAVKNTQQSLSDDDRDVLVSIYKQGRTPVEQLTLHPGQLDKLVKQFRVHTRNGVSGERLLSELLRLRKQGKLPRLRPTG